MCFFLELDIQDTEKHASGARCVLLPGQMDSKGEYAMSLKFIIAYQPISTLSSIIDY